MTTTGAPPPPPSRAIELAVRTVTPVALLVAAFLFFSGHNQPGGGFAAGLVIGAVMGLRMIAGMPFPRNPGLFLAAGAVVVGLTAVAPLLWGDPFFDQVVLEWDVPILGKVKTGSAAVFDLGVVLIVVGLVVAVLDGLGADDLADRVDAGTAR